MSTGIPDDATHFDGRFHLRHEDGKWWVWCPGWRYLCDDHDLFRWARTPQPLHAEGVTS